MYLYFKNINTFLFFLIIVSYINDPSAGSPTETLLRLLLPLKDRIYSSSRKNQKYKISLF
ncbi:hypothetical protein PFMC_00107 [Plasmodium falciparum CAMP/Malaysia]|uniref:Uncharacterized protein n=1 Tax=Plasmodium falciparum (isolate Camp / Malaysia) TaxID=5835 RepID=A0A024XFJ6_PLAFC|nr:hypothetical protein PFMC_00107 [Plasmodium falciparum CAMP/Malaysia]